MERVPDEKGGSPYDPYDEQRLLEMEEGEVDTGADSNLMHCTDDSLLNSSSEDLRPSADPATVPDPASTKPTEPPSSSQDGSGSSSTGGSNCNTGSVVTGTATGAGTGSSTGSSSVSTPELQSSGTHTRAVADNRSNANSYAQKGSSASTTDSAQLPSEYLANKHCTRIRNGAPSIHDGSDIFRVETGSFFNPGDNRHEQCWMVFDNINKWNVSYSFDPVSLLCQCCGKGNVNKKTAYVLSDQNFPACLPSCGQGGACLKIIRIEGGSLSDLASLFVANFKGNKIPAGSVIMLGSATYLATVGLSGYAEEFIDAALKIGAMIDKSCVVTSVPMIMLNGCGDPSLLRSVVEVTEWLKKIFDKVAGYPAEAHQAVLECLAECGKDGYQVSYSVRTRLPSNRFSRVKSTWACPSLVSLPEKLGPISIEQEKKIVQSLVLELNRTMALDLDISPNQNRMVERRSDPNQAETYIVVGSSHASRTAAALKKSGNKVVEVTMPAWRPTTAQIEGLKNKLEKVLGDTAGCQCVVFEFFDNCFYFAQYDDGSLIPVRKGHDGRYHVDGDSVLAPKETQFNLFKKLLPVLETAKEARRILIPPIPRYLHKSCCEDPEHVPNLQQESYKETLISSTYEARMNIKDFAFRLGLRNVATISPWQSIKKLDNVWGADPVHMNQCGYDEIAKLVVEAAQELVKKRKTASSSDRDAKRTRVDGGSGSCSGPINPSGVNARRGGNQPQQSGTQWRGGAVDRGRGHFAHRGRGGRGRPHYQQWRGW